MDSTAFMAEKEKKEETEKEVDKLASGGDKSLSRTHPIVAQQERGFRLLFACKERIKIGLSSPDASRV